MNLFNDNTQPECTNAAEIIQQLNNDQMNYDYINEFITDEGIYQMMIFVKSKLETYEPIQLAILQHMNHIEAEINEFRDDDSIATLLQHNIYRELVLELFFGLYEQYFQQ